VDRTRGSFVEEKKYALRMAFIALASPPELHSVVQCPSSLFRTARRLLPGARVGLVT
jgi:hypothetical protein